MSGTHKIPRHPGVFWYETRLYGKRYVAVASVNGEKRWLRGHKTIKAAEAALEQARGEMQAGFRPIRLTVAEYLDNWLGMVDVRPITLTAYRSRARHASDVLGKLQLSGLRLNDVERLKTALRAMGLAPNSQRSVYATFQNAMAKAVDLGYIATNPCERAKAPRAAEYRPQELATEDLPRLIKAADARGYGALVYLALATGMRKGELFRLAWKDIDFAEGTITVSVAKSRAGERRIALGPQTLRRLQAHRLEQMQHFKVWGRDAGPVLVFTDDKGIGLAGNRFWNQWAKVRTAAGLDGMHFHDLRHAHATLLARAKVQPSVAQKRLGHAKAAMTLDLYTHANTEDQREGAGMIEEVLG